MIIYTPFIVAGQSCDNRQQLDKAEEFYRIGRFYQAIESLKELRASCWEVKLFRPYREETLIELAKNFIALDSLTSASKIVNELLEENPYIEISTPQSLRQMVNKTKARNRKLSLVSVSNNAERIFEAPAATLIITEEQIRQRGYFALDHIFDDIPGFEVYRAMGNTFANIYQRGYRTDNTTRTIFLINGIEDNDFWGNISNWSRQIPLSNIARIEIVYGGNSSIYGKNATGGVVNIITKDEYYFPHEKRDFNVNIDGGYGDYQTRYGDITIGGKLEDLNISFSLTGRVYRSEELDINQIILPEFNTTTINPADFDNVDYYSLLGLNDSELGNVLVERARELDKKVVSSNNFKAGPEGNSLEQYYWAGKMKIGDFTLGYQWWESNQKSLHYNNSLISPGNPGQSVWNPSQSVVFAKFERPIGRKLFLSNTAQFRTSEVGDSSRITTFANYENGQLTLDSLFKIVNITAPFRGELAPVMPNWQTQFFFQNSKQFRNQLRFTYKPSRDWDIIGGVDYRFSTIQGDYRKYGTADFRRVDSISKGEIAIEDLRRSTLDTIPGGNILDYREIGAYLQGTYAFRDQKGHKWINATLGGRFDYSRIGVNGGFGTIFTPKLAMVITPPDFLKNGSHVVLKTIYSESFQDAMAKERFTTNNPDRIINHPDLNPETVRNTEIILGYYQQDKIRLEASYFFSIYSNIINQRLVPICREYNNKGELTIIEGDCEQNDNGKVGETNQYVNLEELSLSGIQSSITAKLTPNFSIYANHIFYNPQNRLFTNSDSISTQQFNIGVNLSFIKNKLNINLRTNFIGDRTFSRGIPWPEELSQSANLFRDYNLLHGTITIRNFIPGLEGLQVQGILTNLEDLDFLHPGIRGVNGIVQAYRTPQRRRSFMVRLIYDLN